MALLPRFAFMGLAALLCSCATIDPADALAQCSLKPSEWRLLPAPPPEEARLGPHFGFSKERRDGRIYWFEGTKLPRELMACDPSYDQLIPGKYTGCASVRMHFPASWVKGDVEPSKELPHLITTC